jgi:hypothetical protein
MLHQPISPAQPGTIDPQSSDHGDRSMDVLQYATAFFAIAVVVLLAVVR